MNFKANMER